MNEKGRKCVSAILLLKIIEDIEKKKIIKKKKIKRRIWVNSFIARRSTFDIEANLLTDLLCLEDDHKTFLRLPYEKFCELLNMVEPEIRKQDTVFRKAITSKVKLAVVLRYLSTGDSFKSLEFLTRISKSTISLFVPETLKAIYKSLQPIYLKFPQNINDWKEISNDFKELWQFPHCLGALDGKHIRIKKPNKSGSMYYNYKGFYSIILLALTDAHCRFIYINVGTNGKNSDALIFNNSNLYQYLKSEQNDVPIAECLEGEIIRTPYFVIADDAFALSSNLMKPYSESDLTTRQEIFNYRLSRARLTVEAAFGQLATRFRIFYRPIELKVDAIDWVIKTCCVLHNYLAKPKLSKHFIEDLTPDDIPSTVSALDKNIETQKNNAAKSIRDKLSNYFINKGEVNFQWEKISFKKKK